MWTTSGRSAFFLVLQHLKSAGVNHVHLPAYLCESLLLPVKTLGLKYSFYPVDLSLTAHPNPPHHSAVLLIHYFGWLNPATSELRKEAGRSFHLIEDACHALLSDWSTSSPVERFVLLSPRKFGPLPLGGWCNLPGEPPRAKAEIEILMWRSLTARLLRGTYLRQPHAPVDPATERFYLSAFQAVDQYLEREVGESGVPAFIPEMAAALDWGKISRRRRRNWRLLHALLANRVQALAGALPSATVPLGYPILLPAAKRDRVRRVLATQRVFCPVHWPLPVEVSARSFPDAATLAQRCMTLPLDQRYDQVDLTHLAGFLLKAL